MSHLGHLGGKPWTLKTNSCYNAVCRLLVFEQFGIDVKNPGVEIIWLCKKGSTSNHPFWENPGAEDVFGDAPDFGSVTDLMLVPDIAMTSSSRTPMSTMFEGHWRLLQVWMGFRLKVHLWEPFLPCDSAFMLPFDIKWHIWNIDIYINIHT